MPPHNPPSTALSKYLRIMKPLSLEPIWFNKTKYAAKISNETLYPSDMLAKNIVAKRRNRIRARASTATGVVLAIVTMGWHVVVVVYSGRNIFIQKQKLALLEQEWERRGHPPVPRESLTQNLLPTLLSALNGNLDDISADFGDDKMSPTTFSPPNSPKTEDPNPILTLLSSTNSPPNSPKTDDTKSAAVPVVEKVNTTTTAASSILKPLNSSKEYDPKHLPVANDKGLIPNPAGNTSEDKKDAVSIISVD